MKKLLLFFSFCSFGLFTNAQTYTLTPGNIDTVDAPFNILSIFDIYQNNISSQKILLRWTKISQSLPAGWDYSLCDLGHCYTGIPSSGTMDSVDVAQQGFLGLNINPFAIAGQGIVKLYVYDAAFPTGGDTVTWVVNAAPVSVEENYSVWNNLSVYPNPATSHITLVNIPENCSAFIYNSVGKLMNEIQLTSSQKEVNISHFSNGIYTLTLIADNKKVFCQKLIVHK